jgi:hypothetical protein
MERKESAGTVSRLSINYKQAGYQKYNISVNQSSDVVYFDVLPLYDE